MAKEEKVIAKIKEMDKKIDDLIERNKRLPLLF